MKPPRIGVRQPREQPRSSGRRGRRTAAPAYLCARAIEIVEGHNLGITDNFEAAGVTPEQIEVHALRLAAGADLDAVLIWSAKLVGHGLTDRLPGCLPIPVLNFAVLGILNTLPSVTTLRWPLQGRALRRCRARPNVRDAPFNAAEFTKAQLTSRPACFGRRQCGLDRETARKWPVLARGKPRTTKAEACQLSRVAAISAQQDAQRVCAEASSRWAAGYRKLPNHDHGRSDCRCRQDG